MGRRDSPERKQRHAADLARCLVRLSTLDGVPWLEQGRTPRPRSAEEAEIVRTLHNLNLRGTIPTLVEVFLFVANASASVQRLLSRRQLRRLVENVLPQGGGAAVRAMADAWLAALRSDDVYAQNISADAQRDRLALTLAFPDAALAIPADTEATVLALLREELSHLKGEHAGEVLSCLVSAEGLAWLRRHPCSQLRSLLRGTIPPALLRRAMRHDVVFLVSELENDCATLTRYLDCLDALGERTILNLDVRSVWFARLFRVGRSWASTVVLTLLGEARQRGAAAERRRSGGGVVCLSAGAERARSSRCRRPKSRSALGRMGRPGRETAA